MSSGSALTDPGLLAALESRRRLLVGDYHRMVEAGVFGEDDRLELLEGVLVFEVASDSLRKDRLAKAALYARAGIPEYVIVNLSEDTLEVHRDPDPLARRYRSVATPSGGDRFTSVAAPGYGFAVADLLA